MEPHLILLDEPTNHLALDSIEALQEGLRAFGGGVVIVSHNESFLASTCNELWVVEDGGLRVVKPDVPDGSSDEEAQEAFADVVAAYRESVLGTL